MPSLKPSSVPNHYGEFEGKVNEIVNNVRERKDAALFEYTEKFDGAKIDANSILVTEEEIAEAYEQVDAKLLEIIRKSKANIEKYHAKQLQNSWFTTEAILLFSVKFHPC